MKHHLIHLICGSTGAADERWRRVQERNARRSETYNLPFDVTREMPRIVLTPTDDSGANCGDG